LQTTVNYLAKVSKGKEERKREGEKRERGREVISCSLINS